MEFDFMSTETVSDVPSSPKVQTNPNYCFRKVTKLNGLGKNVDAICGGIIVVTDIQMQKDGSAVVNSKCGSCETKESDTFPAPTGMKHSERCKNAQSKDSPPLIYLQTVIPRVVWKCAGVPINDAIDDDADDNLPRKFVMCDGLVIDNSKGFPF